MKRFVLIVGVDSDEDQAGFGLVEEEVFDTHNGDLCALLWNEEGDAEEDELAEIEAEPESAEKCVRVDTYLAAVKYASDNDSEIVNVYGAIVY